MNFYEDPAVREAILAETRRPETPVIVLCGSSDCLATAEGSPQELRAAGWELGPTEEWCAEHVPPF